MADIATPSPGIHWPHAYAPERSGVHCINQLEIDRPSGVVWAKLIRAPAWPSWYANASHVAIEGGGDDLHAGAVFHWTTFGVSLVSKVEEFVPGERIAWLAKGSGVVAYHAWLITPTANGCHVLTEETQQGLVARIGRLIFPGRMERWHQRWLEGLAEG